MNNYDVANAAVFETDRADIPGIPRLTPEPAALRILFAGSVTKPVPLLELNALLRKVQEQTH